MRLLKLFKLYVDICLPRAGPQDLPATQSVLILSLLAYIAPRIVLSVTTPSFEHAVFHELVDILILVLVTFILLRLRHLPQRLLQTLSALAGTGAVIGLFGLPLALIPNIPQLLLLLLPIMVWDLTVTGHILRHALNVSLPMGILTGIGYLLISLTLTILLAPSSPARD